jgi:hypothetical protein
MDGFEHGQALTACGDFAAARGRPLAMAKSITVGSLSAVPVDRFDAGETRD